MAAGLGFKTFTTGEVLTAADTNGYLMQGILVFASAAARDAAITSPQEGQACYLKDTNEVLTYSGIAWVAVGTSGGMTLISTTTLSGVTTTLSSIPQTFNSLFLIVTGVTGNTSDQRIRCLPNNVNNLSDSRFVAAAVQSNANEALRLANVTTVRTDADNAFVLQLHNYTSTTTYKPFTNTGFFLATGPTNTAFIAGGVFRSNTAITSLVFDYGGTNTFAGGTVLLYGVK